MLLIQISRTRPYALVVFGILAAALTLASGCATPTPPEISIEDVKGPYAWGSAERVSKVKRLWLSDQPDRAGFAAAKAAGVEVVIDLRASGERDWDEAPVVETLGLEYRNVPVRGSEAFDEATFAEIEAIVRDHAPSEILIHCSSGNRAAAWLTWHLVEGHGLPIAKAIEVGARAGMTNASIVSKTRALLEEDSTSTR